MIGVGNTVPLEPSPYRRSRIFGICADDVSHLNEILCYKCVNNVRVMRFS
jgi:hypothetical protein